MTRRGKLIVYSGPSGVGKGTILKPLLEAGLVTLSVSATTRAPRPGERDGVEYHFVTKERFREMIGSGELLEYAEYNGNYYGTPRFAVEEKLAKGENVILEIEVQGALQVHELCPEAAMIFLMPPSLSELKSRLFGRGTESEDVIAGRLAAAEDEIRTAAHYDFVIVNDDADRARQELAAAINAAGALCRLNQERIEEVLEKC